MKYARFFSLMVAAITLIYAAVAFYFLPLANFEGDLTRVGLLPESSFGWRKPQPIIAPSLLQQASWQEADVLVIGDSFSDSRIWQTQLTAHGLKVRTEVWDVMRGICGDFAPWLQHQGFKGKFVVIEIIERSIEETLARSVACQEMNIHSNRHADEPRSPPAITVERETRHYHGRLSIGIKTAQNNAAYQQVSSTPAFKFAHLPSGEIVARIKHGCALFSHPRCDDALFLALDRAEDINSQALNKMEILNARAGKFNFIWAFVPNKSTAYLYPNKPFWAAAEQRVHAPNLLRMTQEAIQRQTVDLYPANNTHFSTTGYLLMGNEILNAMQTAR